MSTWVFKNFGEENAQTLGEDLIKGKTAPLWLKNVLETVFI